MGQDSQSHVEYRGAKDIERAASLYRSALTKPDPDYSLQLLFAALIANPEHAGAFSSILSKSAGLLAARHKISLRIDESLSGAPADDFIRSLVAYASSGYVDQAITCAAEARKIDLVAHAVALAETLLQSWESGRASVRSTPALKLVDVLESCGAFELAVRVVKCALRTSPNDDALRLREKNLLARLYLVEHDPGTGDFRSLLHDSPRQEAALRPLDPAARADELERQYALSHRPEDFREFIRFLREAPPARREAALPALQDGYERFGEKEILWFIREIQLQHDGSELRRLQKALEANPADANLRHQFEQLHQDNLRRHIDHLSEVVNALPPGPDRMKRELDLARRLMEDHRSEEAVKYAQRLKGWVEFRTDAWIIMAKAFVQMGLNLEAAACFERVLAAVQTEDQDTSERVLDAKYSYAEFLLSQAAEKKDPALAAHARRLCADVMLEDIDYRDIRALSTKADTLAPGRPATTK